MTYVSFMDDLYHFGVFSVYVPSVVFNWFCILRDERVDVAFLSFVSCDQLSYLQLHESKLDQHLINVLFLSSNCYVFFLNSCIAQTS